MPTGVPSGTVSVDGQVVHALKTRSRDGATHEMSARRHLSGEGTVLTMFRVGELIAQHPAEAAMNRLPAKDEPGHVAFGVMHMRYVAEAARARREEIHGYPDEAELAPLQTSQHPTAAGPTAEALCIMLGGGRAGYAEGDKKLLTTRRRQVIGYMKRLQAAGFGERFENGRANPEPVRMLAAASSTANNTTRDA